jgi:hypothetical protein
MRMVTKRRLRMKLTVIVRPDSSRLPTYSNAQQPLYCPTFYEDIENVAVKKEKKDELLLRLGW